MIMDNLCNMTIPCEVYIFITFVLFAGLILAYVVYINARNEILQQFEYPDLDIDTTYNKPTEHK